MSKSSQQRGKDHGQAKAWLHNPFHSNRTIKRVHELEDEMVDPQEMINENVFDKVFGSLMGLAIGDALGASVEFRSQRFLVENRVTDLQSGGTWGLNRGEFTDDTSMALCLANSLVACHDFIAYDQLVRYKWWFRYGYMSSTGNCFDIGKATKKSLLEFEYRQMMFSKQYRIPIEQMDYLHDPKLLRLFDVDCSENGVAGNGALMRLCPVPLFFCHNPKCAVQFSGASARTTHGDRIAIDACRYYGALIVAALLGENIDDLLDSNFYVKHQDWFNNEPLHDSVMNIVQGSFKKRGGYAEGIRGKGFVIYALEAALWALWANKGSFEQGVLAAVNLGDDTDTTAAIYGQLAGAIYGFRRLPKKWRDVIYGRNYIQCLSKWIVHDGERWNLEKTQDYFQDLMTSSKQHTDTITRTVSEDQTPPVDVSSSRSLFKHSSDTTAESKHGSKSNLSSSNTNNLTLKTDSRSYHRAPSEPAHSTAFSANRKPSPASEIRKPYTSSHDRDCASANDPSSMPGYSVEGLETCADVSEWLRNLDKAFANYVSGFETNMVNGFWLLNHVTNESLLKYGVKKHEHQEKILNEIRKIQRIIDAKRLKDSNHTRL
ncbi:unnamed protein product [Adineta ricciae]|uniref:SAM domain-containing protein n=1 Tax=Adineta ricciae TaxID=249248 RepID=A0A814ZHZ0_ADIRI|nr:unnamed protein product [Adineta ricciae]